MDDSRSVQSSGAHASRPALPAKTTSEFDFVCRCCGGTECRVEVRLGVEVALSSLMVYQHVGFSDLAGHHTLYTCTRCEASVRAAHDALRDELLGKLLFAAKHLAERQFTRAKDHGGFALICVECRRAQVADSYLRHDERCHVGRVLSLLSGLMSIDDPRNFDALLDSATGVISAPAAVCAENGGVR